MAQRISFVNLKGGVAKTTSAYCFADKLTHMGYDVLFVDMDPSHNATDTFGAKIENEYTVADLMNNDCTVADAIQKTPMGDIIPGDNALSNVIGSLYKKKDANNILADKLEDVDDDYHFIIIDSPPTETVLLNNILCASDGCIIPTTAESYSEAGLNAIIGTILNIAATTNTNLNIYGILLTKIDLRNKMDKNAIVEIPGYAEKAGIKVFRTYIRTCQDIKNAQDIKDRIGEDGTVIKANRSIYENYSRKCNAYADYEDAVNELVVMLTKSRR